MEFWWNLMHKLNEEIKNGNSGWTFEVQPGESYVCPSIVDHQTSTNWNSIEFIFLTFLFLNLAISKLKNKQEN